MTQILDSLPADWADRILCCYTNNTRRIKIARITNISNWYFERVVFPGEKLLFEATPEAQLEIYVMGSVSAILVEITGCYHLAVEIKAHQDSVTQYNQNLSPDVSYLNPLINSLWKMHFRTSEQPCIATNNSTNKQCQQTLTLEQAKDEIVLLREQISSLQQHLFEQFQHQQVVEQELHYANREIRLMNALIQQWIEVKQLLLEEVKAFSSTLPVDEETIQEELTSLFSKFYDEIVPLEELEFVRSAVRSQEDAA